MKTKKLPFDSTIANIFFISHVLFLPVFCIFLYLLYFVFDNKFIVSIKSYIIYNIFFLNMFIYNSFFMRIITKKKKNVDDSDFFSSIGRSHIREHLLDFFLPEYAKKYRIIINMSYVVVIVNFVLILIDFITRIKSS